MTKYMEKVKMLVREIKRVKYLLKLSREDPRYRPYRTIYKIEFYSLNRQLNNLIF